MRTSTKILIIAAISLILVGSMIFGCVMLTLNWDITKLSTDKYETNEHEISESFSSVSVVTETASIVFLPSDNEKCSVVCYEEEKVKHSVFVKDDTLTVKAVNIKKWHEHIGINIGSPKITVYLPLSEYRDLYVKTDTGAVEIPKDFTFENIEITENTGSVKCYASASDSLKIKTTTGSIRIEGVSANYIDLSVSTGKVTLSDTVCAGDVSVNVSTGNAELSDVSCKNLTSNGSTGGISLVNVIATEKLSVERSTGSVKFSRSDASDILVKTDTGNVSGSLLSEKVFITSTDTGRIDVPKTASGGRCEITTDTGNIIISIEE
ncbi:MAG: DUF4097 family beta strand repeat protein [Clostridia bacterium]|nr:DUF4097 family beta strand repeat protein [Clostridia bacterium]